jgi:hypothetical protein
MRNTVVGFLHPTSKVFMRMKLDFALVQMSFTRAAIAAPSAPVAKVIPAGVMRAVAADAA